MHHLDLFTQSLIDMPETYIKKQLIEYYNQLFGVEKPPERDAYWLMVNGFWTMNQYIAQFQTQQGLNAQDAYNVANMRVWQYGNPSLKDAWTLVHRGFWTRAQWDKLATLGLGFDKSDLDGIYDLFRYDLSIGDIMGLANLIPLDPVYVAKKFAQTGINAEDQAVFTASMQKSVILREIRGIWAQILSVYVYGAFTEEELTALLRSWQFPEAEITIKIATAELVKTKTVNALMRDADIYLYRKDVIVEANGVDGLYDRLIAQDIPADVANAITRNEACKKGLDWELS